MNKKIYIYIDSLHFHSTYNRPSIFKNILHILPLQQLYAVCITLFPFIDKKFKFKELKGKNYLI